MQPLTKLLSKNMSTIKLVMEKGHYTTFKNETVVLRHGREVLVQVDREVGQPGRMFVAVTSDRFRTDYPLLYNHNGQVVWDNPEWFSIKFKDKVAKVMRLIA